MHMIRLSKGKLRAIERESSGSPSVRSQLVRESVCAHWIRKKGIPCWRNPETPCEDQVMKPRYGILFREGSRIMVMGFEDEYLSIDLAAASGCFGAAAVELNEDRDSGRVAGFIHLRDFPVKGDMVKIRDRALESPEGFLHYLRRPSCYNMSQLLFSLRLLLIGEPWPPCEDTAGVPCFSPAVRPRLEGLNER